MKITFTLALVAVFGGLPIHVVNAGPTFSDANWMGHGGFNGAVQTVVTAGNDLYAVGGFTRITNSGGTVVTVNRIARFNGSSWSALGLGANDNVYAIALAGTNMYVGGDFTMVTNSGGASVAALRVAKWDGNSWSALGAGTAIYVRTLAVMGNDLYVGGNYGISRWDGNNWWSLGSGVNGGVAALKVSGGDLYVGGGFLVLLGGPGNNIAKWDGNSWEALGTGMNAAVTALAIGPGGLYAGGNFSTAGGNQAFHIAKWNGNSWSPVGGGVNGQLDALAVSGNNLYAGGFYPTIATNNGGQSVVVNHVAKWDGTNWSAFGSGTSQGVYTVAATENDLYVGGPFQVAGGKALPYLARARLSFVADNVALRTDFPGINTNTIAFAGVPACPYVVEFATNLTGSPWFVLSTNVAATNGIGAALDTSPTNSQRYYRVGVAP